MALLKYKNPSLLLSLIFIFVHCAGSEPATLDCQNISSATCQAILGQQTESDMDADLSATPPEQQSLSSIFFTSSDALQLSDWDEFPNQENLPDFFVLTITSADDMGKLHTRTLLREILRVSSEQGSSPIIMVKSLLDKPANSGDDLASLLNDSQWVSFFFNQLQNIIEICNASTAQTLIVLEPHLVDGIINHLAADSSASNKNYSLQTVQTEEIYQLGFLDKDNDPAFGNNLPDFIKATNYLFSKYATENLLHGWQISTRMSVLNALGTDENEIKNSAKDLDNHFSALEITSYSTQIMLFDISLIDSNAISSTEIQNTITGFIYHLYNEAGVSPILSGINDEDFTDEDWNNFSENLEHNHATGVILN